MGNTAFENNLYVLDASGTDKELQSKSKRRKQKKKSNFEKGIEMVCSNFDTAAEKEIKWHLLFNNRFFDSLIK